jgi:hypothetical protein
MISAYFQPAPDVAGITAKICASAQAESDEKIKYVTAITPPNARGGSYKRRFIPNRRKGAELEA